MPPDVQTIIVDTARLSDAAVARLQGRMQAFEAQVLLRLRDFLARFDTQDGAFVGGEKATALLLQIKRELQGIVELKELDAAAKEFLVNFDDVAANVRAVHGEQNGLNVPKSLVNDSKAYAVEQTLFSLREANINPRFIEPVRKVLFNHINFGGGVREAEGVLAKLITGEPDKLNGALTQWIGQVATDAINQFEGTVQAAIAQQYGLTGVRYVNSIIETSRAQCVRWVDMQWLTEAEIPREIAWAFQNGTGMIPGTDATTFLVNRGGYRCRHKGIPVRDELARKAKGSAPPPPQKPKPKPKPVPPAPEPPPPPAPPVVPPEEQAALDRIARALAALDALTPSEDANSVRPPINRIAETAVPDVVANVAGDSLTAEGLRSLANRITVQDVPIAQLVTYTGSVYAPAVRRYIQSGSVVSPTTHSFNDGGSLPLVVKDGDRFYLIDGNHRVTAQILLGQTVVPMRVVEAPKPAKKKVAPKKKKADADGFDVNALAKAFNSIIDRAKFITTRPEKIADQMRAVIASQDGALEIMAERGTVISLRSSRERTVAGTRSMLSAAGSTLSAYDVGILPGNARGSASPGNAYVNILVATGFNADFKPVRVSFTDDDIAALGLAITATRAGDGLVGNKGKRRAVIAIRDGIGWRPWTILTMAEMQHRSIAPAITHEVAHIIQNRFDPKVGGRPKRIEDRAAGEGITLNDAPTAYGTTNWAEFWTETFSAYVYANQWLKDTRPKVFAFFETMLVEYGIDKNTITLAK